MDITVELAFDEGGALRLLNWLAHEDKRIYRMRPDLPGLYASGVRYHPDQDGSGEAKERFADVLNMYLKGHEDCDSLAAARAGELMARGWRALDPSRGDYGAKTARRLRLNSVPAKVILRTRVDPGQSGMYHCLVKYRVLNRVFYDDPSIRLGMRTNGAISAMTLRQPVLERPRIRQLIA